MPQTTLTTQPSSPWVRESPVTMIEGESRAFALTVVGASSVTVGASATIGYNGEGVASPAITSGSSSASGIVITTNVISTLKGGETYVIATTATVDGRTDIILCEIRCLFPYGPGVS
jgi:hypothetical protein